MAARQYATYEWAVASLRFNLSIMGLWQPPKNPKDKIFNTLPIICATSFVLFCHLAPQTWALCRIYGHFELLLVHTMAMVPYCFSIVKMYFLLCKASVIHKFFSTIKQDWQMEMTWDEREIMMRYWKLAKQVHLCGFLFAVFSPLTSHSVLPFNRVVRVITNLTDTIPGRYLPFYTVYPYDTQPTPVFELTVINEVIGSLIVTTSLVVADVLYTALVLHTCAQLDLLTGRIETIVENHYRNVYEEMTFYVQRHLQIIRFAKDIDDLFNGILLIIVIGFTVGFCAQAFTGIVLLTQEMSRMEKLVQLPFFIVYSFYLCFTPFVYCWAGEKLMEKSLNVSNATYNSNWINLAPSTSILLCLVALRAQRPLAVTAGKFLPITLNTYTKLIKTCCGYISMLHALNN